MFVLLTCVLSASIKESWVFDYEPDSVARWKSEDEPYSEEEYIYKIEDDAIDTFDCVRVFDSMWKCNEPGGGCCWLSGERMTHCY